MRRLLQLQAITRQNRHEVNRFIFDTVSALGGWIDDVQMYSNLMSTIRMTLPRGRYGEFSQAMTDFGVSVELPEEFTAPLEEASEQPASLQVTFVHNEPDLRREIPAVPG